MVFPLASAVSNPDLDFPKVVWVQGVAWALLFPAAEEEAACKRRKGKKPPLLAIPGAPSGVPGPEAAFPECRDNPEVDACRGMRG